MSAFVQVRSYGEDIRVICDPCHLDERCFLYKTANHMARTHNAEHHPTAVDWAA